MNYLNFQLFKFFNHPFSIVRLCFILLSLTFTAHAQKVIDCSNAGSCTKSFNTEYTLPAEVFLNCDSITPIPVNNSAKNTKRNISFYWTTPSGKHYTTQKIHPEGPGTYQLCYDSIGDNGSWPLEGTCPKSVKVIVTNEVRPSFADAGPRNVNICFDTEYTIGTTGDTSTYKYQWGAVSKVPTLSIQNMIIGSSTTVPNPKIYFLTNSKYLPNSKYYWPIAIPIITFLDVTDKKSGCKQTDTITMNLLRSPFLEVNNLQESYCEGDQAEIEISSYYNSNQYKSLNLKIDNHAVDLAASPADSIVNKKYSFLTDGFKEAGWPTQVYKIKLPPGTHGNHPINLTAVSIDGCKSTLDTSVFYNGGQSNITVSGLTKDTYCGDTDEDFPIKAYSSPGVEATAGTISINPPTPAFTGDKTTGYKFNPSKAAGATYQIVYKEEKVGNSCGSTGIDTVIVKALPIPKIFGRTSVCVGATMAEYLDTANLDPNLDRKWSVIPSNSILTEYYGDRPLNDSVTVNWSSTPGKAHIVVTNEEKLPGGVKGCRAVDTLEVTISNILNSSKPVASDDPPCSSNADSVMYTTEGGKNYQRKWFVKGGTFDPKYSDFSAANSIKVKWLPNQSEYLVWVRDTNIVQPSCFGNSDTLKVVFATDPIAKILGSDSVIGCIGDTLILRADTTSGTSFTWNPGNLKGPVIKYTTKNNTPFPSTIELTVGKGSLCPETSDVINILSKPRPTPPLAFNSINICLEDIKDGDTVITVVKDDPANRIIWGNDTLASQTQFRINQSDTIYKIGQVDVLGCSNIVNLSVNEICEPRIYVPDAFSPNNDNTNDSLVVQGNRLNNYLLTIYNRWGEVIFTSKDKTKYWDGRFNNDFVPSGIYPWIITVDHVNENGNKKTITKKGGVSVVR